VLSDCQVLSNTAQVGGAGIYNQGTLTLVNSTLISNTAPYGGSLDNLGYATLQDCTVRENLAPSDSSTGGGLLNEPGATLSVTGGTVSANTAGHDGGGIYNNADGTLFLTGCTFTDSDARHAGAAIYNLGLAILSNCNVGPNAPGIPAEGTIYNAGTMTINGGSIHDNFAYYGGGIMNTGALDIAYCTIYSNHAYYGTGIYNLDGTVTISHSAVGYNGPSELPFAIGTGAITITYSSLAENGGIEAAVIAHSSIISTNTEYVSVSTLVGNEITGNSPGVVAESAHLNNFLGNQCALCPTSGMARAQANWWGSASGPSGAGSGMGDAVNVNVDYTPWLGSRVRTGTVATARVTNGTLDARATSDIEVDVAGTTTVYLGKLYGSPGGPQPFVPLIGGFFDVLHEDASDLSQVTIRYYYPRDSDESVLGLWWWDGALWRKCSDQGIQGTDLSGYGGYLWARITSGTVPTLDELKGGPFAAAENWLVLQQGVQGYTGSADTYLSQNEPTTSYCSGTLFKVGYKQQNAALVRFALPALPDGVGISRATLQVYAYGWSGQDMSLGAYVVTRTVDVCQATWDQAGAGNPWGTWGGNDTGSDRRPDPESTLTTMGNHTWYDLDLTAAVRGWNQGTLANNGVLLRGMTMAEISFYFASAEFEPAEYRPRLVIRWQPLPTATPTPTATGTNTPTPTPTETATPTATPTASPTATATDTPTPTASQTTTGTLMPTATASPTATATPTRTPTATATFTLTPTPSRHRIYLPWLVKGHAR
jgi:hypothetical protein